MTTDRLVSAAAYGDSYDKPISDVLHHVRGHDREGRNPATGQAIHIPASRKLAYVAAKQVKDRLGTAAG